jgi:mxaL protein
MHVQLAAPRFDAQLLALALSVAALALALTRPTLVLERDAFRHLLVFDITQSMNVEDVPWRGGHRSRLEHAKASAIDALARLPCGSAAGVGLFTGHRTLLLFAPVEVCEHYGDISMTIRSVDWRMAWAARSEVAKGLHSSLEAARTLGRGTTIAFLTDCHEAPPLHPDHQPRFDGVPGEVGAVVAGFGGLEPVPIPKLDANGKAHGHWSVDDVQQIDSFTLGRHTSVSGEGLSGIDTADVQARVAAGREHVSSLREDYLRGLTARLGLRYGRVESAADLTAALQHPDLAIARAAPADLRPALAALALALLLLGHGCAALGRASLEPKGPSSSVQRY